MEFRDFFLGDMYGSLTYVMAVSVLPHILSLAGNILVHNRILRCSSAFTFIIGLILHNVALLIQFFLDFLPHYQRFGVRYSVYDAITIHETCFHILLTAENILPQSYLTRLFLDIV